MWANLQNSDLSGSKLDGTIFIEAYLQNTNLDNLKMENAFIKFAKLGNGEDKFSKLSK
jgi:uncharacterized protein YjbI with pentapeptide repeats